jgi:muconolactone delta-isomerase
MPQLAFLHGNVVVGFCADCRRCGWHDDTCDGCGASFTPSPLLFPTRDKDYKSHLFIANEWALLEDKLANAYFVTVFGYSAPSTDVAARDALLKVWSSNPAREIAEIELIDTKPRDELHQTWADFITRSHYITTDRFLQSYACWHPRRSCDALYAATMMNQPFKEGWLPEFSSVGELRTWVDPLYREELEIGGSNKRFSGRPCREYHESEGGQ